MSGSYNKILGLADCLHSVGYVKLLKNIDYNTLSIAPFHVMIFSVTPHILPSENMVRSFCKVYHCLDGHWSLAYFALKTADIWWLDGLFIFLPGFVIVHFMQFLFALIFAYGVVLPIQKGKFLHWLSSVSIILWVIRHLITK